MNPKKKSGFPAWLEKLLQATNDPYGKNRGHRKRGAGYTKKRKSKRGTKSSR